MKTIGLIGGLSWQSTNVYYEQINKLINKNLGNLHSAKIILHSLDYENIAKFQRENKWLEIEILLIETAKNLQNSGAECILICCNTAHLVAENIQKEINIPLIHIADVTGNEIIKRKLAKVSLLGTLFTMNKDFFKQRLKYKFNIETIVPNEEDKEFIHYSIYHEFSKGIFKEETKLKILEIIDKLKKQGTEGVILGCTELPMLINTNEHIYPFFDTTLIHSTAAVKFALTNNNFKNEI